MKNIVSKKDLKEFIEYERHLYEKKRRDIGILPRLSEKSILWRFICLLRYEEYHLNNKHKIRNFYYRYRKTKMGRKYGINIGPNLVDKGLKITHLGYIYFNAESIGKNCLCNANVALVAGGHDGAHPTIGNNVAIGYGATIAGGVFVPDGVAIGACSLVIKPIEKENVAVAGVPAKIVSENGSSTWGGMKIYTQFKESKND